MLFINIKMTIMVLFDQDILLKGRDQNWLLLLPLALSKNGAKIPRLFHCIYCLPQKVDLIAIVSTGVRYSLVDLR